MTRHQQREFYQTRAWRRAARACRERAGWLCERCKAEGLTAAAAVAHHKTPLDKGGAKFGPLIALCRTCHESEHDRAPSEQQKEWNEYIDKLRKRI